MQKSRRNFLKLGTLGTLAATLPVEQTLAWMPDEFLPGRKLPNFGLQIWSVKEDMAADAKGTFKALAGYGYKQLESFEGKEGMFWGMKHLDFKSYMADLGISVVSSHCNISDDFEKKAAQAAEAGLKYLICPWKGPQKSIDDFKRFTEEFNNCGSICKKNGIRFAYHNHDYSFKKLDGEVPQIVMMEQTDPELVDFEMDIYWVVNAGEKPADWLTKYKNRFRLCHIKDRMKQPLPDNKNSSCQLGKGSIGYPGILKTAIANGMQYFIVEQEYFEGTTPMKSAQANALYMKKLLIP